MGQIDMVLTRDRHRAIANAPYDNDEQEYWTQTRSKDYVFDDTARIGDQIGDAADAWADVLDLEQVQVEPERLKRGTEKYRPHRYPVEMTFAVHDAPHLPDHIKHTVELDEPRLDDPFTDGDRLHRVNVWGGDSAQYTTALAYLHGFTVTDDQHLALDDAEDFRRIRYTGDEILGGDRTVEYRETR